MIVDVKILAGMMSCICQNVKDFTTEFLLQVKHVFRTFFIYIKRTLVFFYLKKENGVNISNKLLL